MSSNSRRNLHPEAASDWVDARTLSYRTDLPRVGGGSPPFRYLSDTAPSRAPSGPEAAAPRLEAQEDTDMPSAASPASAPRRKRGRPSADREMSSQSQSAQEWVDQQVLLAREDREPGIYSRRQAFKHPRTLYRRWMRLNRTLGTDRTVDTWATNGAIGVGIAIAVAVAFHYAGGGVLAGNALTVGIIVGILLGGFVFYNRMIRDVFAETYVETLVSEYHSALADGDDVTDVSIIFLQRLAFYNRPEVFEGNQGRNGFQDKDAVVRLKMPYGKSISSLRESEDYYYLPGDPSPLVLATAIMRYSIVKLVRKAGTLYRLHAVPRTQQHWSAALKSSWQWIVTIVFVAGAIIVATQ